MYDIFHFTVYLRLLLATLVSAAFSALDLNAAAVDETIALLAAIRGPEIVMAKSATIQLFEVNMSDTQYPLNL